MAFPQVVALLITKLPEIWDSAPRSGAALTKYGLIQQCLVVSFGQPDIAEHLTEHLGVNEWQEGQYRSFWHVRAFIPGNRSYLEAMRLLPFTAAVVRG